MRELLHRMKTSVLERPDGDLTLGRRWCLWGELARRYTGNRTITQNVLPDLSPDSPSALPNFGDLSLSSVDVSRYTGQFDMSSGLNSSNRSWVTSQQVFAPIAEAAQPVVDVVQPVLQPVIDAAVRVDQFGGQVNSLLWTGDWVDAQQTSGVGVLGSSLYASGRAGVRGVIATGNGVEQLGCMATDLTNATVECVSGYQLYRGDLSQTCQALNSGQLGYGQYYAEYGANTVTLGVYGEAKACYQLSTGQISLDQATDTLFSTSVMQFAGAKIMQVQAASPGLPDVLDPYEGSPMGTTPGAFIPDAVDPSASILLAEANDSLSASGSSVHPNVPEWVDGAPAQAILKVNGVEIPLRSGVTGPGEWLGQSPGGPGSGLNAQIPTHVEGQAAGLFYQYGLDYGELFVNKPPCATGAMCRYNLGRILPQGSVLDVSFPDPNGGVSTWQFTGGVPRWQPVGWRAQ
jgi:hypothetical protein